MDQGFARLLDATFCFFCCVLLTITLAPQLLTYRSQARVEDCRHHLRLLGLAMHNYHAAYNQLPLGCGGTFGGATEADSNQGRLGPFIGVLPFAEEQGLWEVISNPYVSQKTGKRFPAMGPVPWYDPTEYVPWLQGPMIYRCPDAATTADQQTGAARIVFTLQDDAGLSTMANYVACYGDGTFAVGALVDPESEEDMERSSATNRGAFLAGVKTTFRDFLDGTANTLLFSETLSSLKGEPRTSGIAKDIVGLSLDPSLCLKAGLSRTVAWNPIGRGSRWSDGALPVTGFQAVLPPNSPSCSSDLGPLDAICSASSAHAGGVHVLIADGAVRFVSDTIHTGDLTSPGVAIDAGYTKPGSVSPYGLWGALGTRASIETINDNELESSMTNFKTDAKDFSKRRQAFTPWKDKTSTITLTAKFLRLIDRETVELEDTGGTIHRVPLNSLSAEGIYNAVEQASAK